jgi:hypothetical protein
MRLVVKVARVGIKPLLQEKPCPEQCGFTSERVQASHNSLTEICMSSFLWKARCLRSWPSSYFNSSLRNCNQTKKSASWTTTLGGGRHLVRLGEVDVAVGVVVQLLVQRPDGLEARLVVAQLR